MKFALTLISVFFLGMLIGHIIQRMNNSEEM